MTAMQVDGNRTLSQQPSLSQESQGQSLFSSLNQVDSYADKATLATLIVLDKASFISPLRWLVPVTATDDGQDLGLGGLYGCGKNDLKPMPQPTPTFDSDGGSQDAGNSCLSDKDCRAPHVCQEGECVEPPPPPQPECTHGDTRACGPCDVGYKSCDKDGFWESDCKFSPDQLTRHCYTGPDGTEGVGECHGGTQSCSANEWTDCEGEMIPHTETCDGQDNDCDGATDNGPNGSLLQRDFYPGPTGTEGVGICKGVQQYCSDGKWISLNDEQPVLPQAETCNDKDDNCDGNTDETGCGTKIGDGCHVVGNLHGGGSSDCVTYMCISSTTYPDGYCTDKVFKDASESPDFQKECAAGSNFRKAVCVQNSQLGVDTELLYNDGPNNSIGYWHDIEAYFCVVTCAQDSDCRVSEGYVCKNIINSALKACMPADETVAIGTGACAKVNP